VNFRFTDKTVYLLSSERWGNMRVSKHHYALELVEKGNKVYFIEPPDLANKGIKIEPSGELPGLFIVKYRPVYRGKRFLPAFLFNIMVRLQVVLLIKAIGQKPDVLFCIDPYRFMNLQWFKAPVSIFFAADLFSYNELPGEAYTADICFGVSDTIIKVIEPANSRVFFINHGLSKFFIEKAVYRLKNLPVEQEPGKKITIGYVGNLLMEAPDREVMRRVISTHPDCHFIFWGQYEKKGNFVAFNSPEVFEFVDFLKASPNVELRGAVHSSVLSAEIEKADMFWVCWKLATYKLWDGSNSHKILEYLSTGKPVVSHFMSTYQDTIFIDMLQTKESDGYEQLFSKVLQRVKNGEPVVLQKERIQFAINNSYSAQIATIEKLIQQHVK
jgi:glycosyltransferase involved in cell wall biosynthesis